MQPNQQTTTKASQDTIEVDFLNYHKRWLGLQNFGIKKVFVKEEDQKLYFRLTPK